MGIIFKRWSLFVALLTPALVFFWVMLMTWLYGHDNIESDLYAGGWYVTTILLLGMPMVVCLFAAFIQSFGTDCEVEERYHQIGEALNHGRVCLARRLEVKETSDGPE